MDFILASIFVTMNSQRTGGDTLKIVMISPARLDTGAIRLNRPLFGPTSLATVAGAIDHEHEIEIIDESIQGRITESSIPDADLYALSFLSTCRKGAIRIAKILKQTGKPVIAGGIDVTSVYRDQGPDMFVNENGFDAIVVGGLTKRLMAEVLTDCEQGKLERVYQKKPNEPFEFHSPRYDLTANKYWFNAVQSSAGCNFSCPFCTVHEIIGRKRVVCVRPLGDLEKDLASLKTKGVADVADSFGADYKHTMEVLKIYQQSGKKIAVEATVKALRGVNDNPHYNDERKELITPMSESGVRVAYMAVESLIGDVSAKSTQVRFYEQTALACRQAGMMTIGSFMFDVIDLENPDSIRRMVDWAEKYFDFAQFSLTAALPGSEIRRVAILHDHLIDDNPEHMSGAFPTIYHPTMTAKERIEAMAEAYQKFYGWHYIGKRLRRTPLGMLPLMLGVNTAFHFVAKKWWKEFTYERWEATKE